MSQATRRMFNIMLADVKQSLRVREEVVRMLRPEECDDLEDAGLVVRIRNHEQPDQFGRKSVTITKAEKDA